MPKSPIEELDSDTNNLNKTIKRLQDGPYADHIGMHSQIQDLMKRRDANLEAKRKAMLGDSTDDSIKGETSGQNVNRDGTLKK